MFRERKRRIAGRNSQLQDETHQTEYPFRLNFYDTPPQEEVTLEEFEQWAIDRLKVLGEVDACIVRNRNLKEMESSLRTPLTKYLPLNNLGKSTRMERKKDHYSHFILRLAFCRSQELRAKFVRLETALFKVRFITDMASTQKSFVQSLNLNWDPVDERERVELFPLLNTSTVPSVSPNESFFKVDFQKVDELVSTRNVLVRKGKAYVPMSLQLSLISGEFSRRLEQAMEITARALPRLDEEERLVPILAHLSNGFTWSTYEGPTYSDEGFRAESIDQLEKQGHLPLCMSTMHRGLRVNKHAKFNTRLQYGRFLKGIGLNVDEALKFWRSSFQKIGPDQFDKEHRYNFRHMYGLEGRRHDYSPMGCVEITKSPMTNDGETHGCPYRYFTTDRLVSSLKEMGVKDGNDLRDITTLAENKHYHMACTRVYELTHPNDKTDYKESLTNPNTYFSRSYEHGKKMHADNTGPSA
jgi:DNA primase large subunit